MDASRARGVLSLPGLLSLARAPLAVAFAFEVEDPVSSLCILAAAAVTDVADGWVARRFGLVTSAGAILDPLMDKFFVATVLAALVLDHRLALTSALVLVLRDVAEAPLAVLLVRHPHALDLPRGEARANILGKTATVLQFAVIAALVYGVRHGELLVLPAGALGVAAAASYWARAIGRGSRLRRRTG